MLDTDKSYIRHRLVKLCQCMDYLNESVQSTIDLGVTNKFTQLMFDSVETDFKQAYIELRDAKEVYYANQR